MALVEIFVTNGTPLESNVIIDGETITLDDLTAQEVIDLNGAVETMMIADNTNCGWLMDVANASGAVTFNLKENAVIADITICDKGGIIDEDIFPTIHTPLNALLTSILNRI